jgi:hypothetical protein
MDRKEIGSDDVNRFDLARDRGKCRQGSAATELLASEQELFY